MLKFNELKIKKIYGIIRYVNRLKEKNMVISINAKKKKDKISPIILTINTQ